jgi:hypothetical protein
MLHQPTNTHSRRYHCLVEQGTERINNRRLSIFLGAARDPLWVQDERQE